MTGSPTYFSMQANIKNFLCDEINKNQDIMEVSFNYMNLSLPRLREKCIRDWRCEVNPKKATCGLTATLSNGCEVYASEWYDNVERSITYSAVITVEDKAYCIDHYAAWLYNLLKERYEKQERDYMKEGTTGSKNSVYCHDRKIAEALGIDKD